jgi:hypothetical protein
VTISLVDTVGAEMNTSAIAEPGRTFATATCWAVTLVAFITCAAILCLNPSMSKSSCCSVENSVGNLIVKTDVDMWIVESSGLTGVAVVASVHAGQHIQNSKRQR